MTNMEYYREQIKAIADGGNGVAIDVKSGNLKACVHVSCRHCKFDVGRCNAQRVLWLMAEHEEEPILIKKGYHLVQLLPDGWVARDADSLLYWYKTKPKKLVDYWDNLKDDCEELTWLGYVFDFIRWEDDEPWSVEDLRKLKVREDVKEEPDGRKEV